MAEHVKTSELLALQKVTTDELHARFAEMFRRHRKLAFMHRHDEVFVEHWTPESAAAAYEFDSYELKGGHVVLSGVEYAAGFTYRISIAFPVELVDDPVAIDQYFTRQLEQQRVG